MAEVKVSETIAAPAEKVWALLGDFGGVQKWGGSMLQSCSVEGSGVGAVRTIGLPGNQSIRERCEAHDDAGRALTYSIVGKSPIPIRDYVSTCRVVATGPDACRVDWQGRFEPDGVPEEAAGEMIRSIYTGGITAVRKLLGA
ncbi:MAG TPA: SRPBCC family protein [Candidatus Binatia bacterium]|nr:SRPBCC family protein [Candidatus Binatia bacterium]